MIQILNDNNNDKQNYQTSIAFIQTDFVELKY